MADWQTKIDFSREKRDFQDGEIELKELIRSVINEINRVLPSVEKINSDMASDLECEVLPMFEELEEYECDVDDFDNALEYLYDWADTSLDNKFGGKKMCWIKP
jgi:uncharacterized protein Yka (UPF0111/DUF47 family)